MAAGKSSGTVGHSRPLAVSHSGPVGAGYGSVADAAQRAEVVVLATPWPAAADAAGAADTLGGNLLLDRTNPLRIAANGPGPEIGHTMSDVEGVAASASGAAVFKTLNQTRFANRQDPRSFVPLPAVMCGAGADETKQPLVP